MSLLWGGRARTKIEICSRRAQISIPISLILSSARTNVTALFRQKKFKRDVGLVLFGLLWFAVIARLFFTI